MESQKYYMSIGYPIGLCQNDDGDKFFNIEDKGEFFGVYNDSYMIWKHCFFDMKTKEDIIKSLKMSEFNVGIEISRLKSYGILIEIESTKINDLYELLKDLYPIKNGFGHGLTKDGLSASVLNQGQNFMLSLDDFCLWSLCNNRNNISYFIDWYANKFKCTKDKAKYEVINTIFVLKTMDLIRISH